MIITSTARYLQRKDFPFNKPSVTLQTKQQQITITAQ